MTYNTLNTVFTLNDLDDIGSFIDPTVAVAAVNEMNSNHTYTITSSNPYNSVFSVDDTRTLNVTGDANFGGDVKIQGKSISDTLKHIEERLAILHVNPELEEKWGQLKTLGRMYKELEQEILEKEEMWKIIKR